MKKLMALVLSFAMVFAAVPVFAVDTGAETGVGTDKVDINAVDVEAIADQAHTGSPIVLKADDLKVSYGGKALVAGTDYTVGNFKNNTLPGTATFDLQGKATGTYQGTKPMTFKITKDFTEAEVAQIAADMGAVREHATGAEFECPAVKWGGLTLEKDRDYTVTADTSKAGEQTATIKFIGAYSGKDITKTFKVVDPKKDFTEAKIYFASSKAYSFTGAEVNPEVRVGYHDVMLTEGTDYTVSYKDNINAGTAKVVVKGAGSFDGTKEQEFTIAPADMKDVTVTLEKDAYTATGSQIKPAVTSVKLGTYELTAADYKVTYGENKEIGEGTVIVNASDVATASKNFTGSITVKFVIAAKTAEDFTVTLDKNEYAYDGTAKTPAVTVKDGDKTLVKDTDYTVAYENNTNAGTAKVIVTAKGNYTGSKTVEFTIKGTDAPIFTDANSYTKYVPTSKPFSMNAKTDGDAKGFSYASSNTNVVTVDASGIINVVDAGVATIKVSTVGTEGSNPATKEVKITVKPLKPAFSLSSPAKKQVKVTVTKEPGATKYQVRYGRMGNYYYKNITHIDNEFAKTYTYLNNRTSGKTYFIKVRAYKVMEDGTIVYGNWSATKQIKSK